MGEPTRSLHAFLAVARWFRAHLQSNLPQNGALDIQKAPVTGTSFYFGISQCNKERQPSLGMANNAACIEFAEIVAWGVSPILRQLISPSRRLRFLDERELLLSCLKDASPDTDFIQMLRLSRVETVLVHTILGFSEFQVFLLHLRSHERSPRRLFCKLRVNRRLHERQVLILGHGAFAVETARTAVEVELGDSWIGCRQPFLPFPLVRKGSSGMCSKLQKSLPACWQVKRHVPRMFKVRSRVYRIHLLTRCSSSCSHSNMHRHPNTS